MATVNQTATPQSAGPDHLPAQDHLPEMKIISHSNLFYWWPIWAFGYALALLTYAQGESVRIGGKETTVRVSQDNGKTWTEEVVKVGGQNYWVHPNKNVGVFYTAVFMIVILFSNIQLRGMTSVAVILMGLFFTVLFAWLDWWEEIFKILPYLAIYMNMGFYVFFSTALFIIWAAAFFVFDRMTYFTIRPGQMTMVRIVGGGNKSYDTRGMLFEKHAEDFFKHFILGLGAGDLRISTSGARSEEIYIPNVAFVDRKVRDIQKLISIKPDETPDRVVMAGAPE